MPTPERLVRQAAAHSPIRAFFTRLGSRIPPRLSMLNGLRVGFDSVYASAGPRVDVACGYIGGDTPHVWTAQEWASRPERWRLPIYVRSFAGNGAADGAQAKGWAQNMKMPAGAVIAYDLEQLQDAPMVNAFKAAIAPYVCMVYGAESYVRANPAPWWEAAWNNSPTLDSPSAWGHQYQSTNTYDLNVFAPGCPLWDMQGPAPTPTPQPKRGKKVFIFELPNGSLYVGDLVTFRWLTGAAVDKASFLIARAGGDPTPVKVDRWQEMGVPADPGTATAAGTGGYPASAS